MSRLDARKGILTLAEAKESVIRSLHLGGAMPLLLGQSGAGKSAVIEGLTDLIPNSVLRPMSLVSLEAYDFAGIPGPRKYKDANGDTIDERMGFLSPAMIPLVGDEKNPEIIPPGTEMFIIFIDEIPEGDEQTLKALYRILNERTVQDRKIHPMVRFVGAGNRAEDGANTKQLPPPISNRMMHITVQLNVEEWVTWAAKNNVLPEIRAFILNNPQYLHTYVADSFASGTCGEAWSSPRSLFNLDKYLQGNGRFPKLDLSDETDFIAQSAPASFIGNHAGQALIDYTCGNLLPPLADILADPLYDLNQLSPGQMFLLGQSLLDYANGSNIKDVLRVLGNMPKDHKVINYMQLPHIKKELYMEVIADPSYRAFAVENVKLLKMITPSK